MTEAFFHIETNLLICSANQWTGFYMITAYVMKGLNIANYASTDRSDDNFLMAPIIL